MVYSNLFLYIVATYLVEIFFALHASHLTFIYGVSVMQL